MSERTDRAREAQFGAGGSPVGSPLTIVLAIIAVAAGFLIFRSIDAGEAGGGDDPGGGPVATDPEGSPGTQPEGDTATTAAAAGSPEATRSGAKVVVINAGEVAGSAGRMTDQLERLGYDMEPGISDDDDVVDETTVVWFAGDGAPRQVAQQVAADLGGVDVEEAPSPLPILQGDSPGAATVFVWLGADLADQALPLDN